MRDAINKSMEKAEDANNGPFISIVQGLTNFAAYNEWFTIAPYFSITAPPGAGVLVFDEASLPLLITEPIFAVGPKRYTIQSAGLYLLIRAPRREMLPGPNAFDGTRESAYSRQLATISGGGLIDAVGGKWLILDINLQWVQANVNTVPAGGLPFGRNAPFAADGSSLRGRYYELEWAFTASAGAPQMSIVHQIGTTVVSNTIGLAGTPNAGIAKIGDSTQGISGAAAFSRAIDFGSSNWTLALTSGANGTVTFDTLKVIRQGY